MKKFTIIKMVLTGLMIAVVFLATRFTAIPVGIGYFNVGDAAIMLTAVILGRNSGFVAGAFGSALSDFLSPWAYYSPITFIVKGMEGFVIGTIAYKSDYTKKGYLIRLVAISAGTVVMIGGYFLGDLFGLKFVGQSFGIAMAVNNLPLNLIQGASSMILGTILVSATSKARLGELIRE